jgi:hypothetical protein
MKKRKCPDTAPALHRKLWAVMSIYIRTRDCFYTTGTIIHGNCSTCGDLKPFALLDAGHFQKRKWTAIKYDEHNVAIQCKKCNGFNDGEQDRFAIEIEARWGKDELERLRSSRGLKQWKSHELQELIDTYTRKLAELKGETQ